jgi:hypothetical protein
MKQLFGKYYYTMEDSFNTKLQAAKFAKKIKETGKWFVRIAYVDYMKQYGVFLRRR